MNAWWKIGIIAGYTLAVMWLTHHIDAAFCSDAARALAEQQQAATIAQQFSVIGQERKAQNITNEVSNAYESKISLLDNAYSNLLAGVQQPSPGNTGALSSVSDTASGHNAAPGAAGLPQSSRAIIINLAHQADIQTQRLMACQAWIRAQQDGSQPAAAH